MPNRLARERSPYLLQHARNPVDWFPWGDEAFERARDLDRPIFLSIGYSTCHWCHVMEHESFEHPAIAAELNAHFVAIKVDREERPDVDRVYMLFVQATTGAGGWPMSVWLTPDLKPFFGGTYFPPESRWGRPGFLDMLRRVARAWHEDRTQVVASSAALFEQLAEASTRGTDARAGRDASVTQRAEGFEAGTAGYEHAFDERHGGFGDAPKFPRPSELLYLMRVFAVTGREPIASMVEASLRAMALGGMRDHVGGGFHRYAVDAAWRVPHFEKMLYDQAQLALAFLELAQLRQDDFYAAVADDTLDYVRRRLTDEHGACYSAEDADSLPPPSHASLVVGREDHKAEGAFYLWTVAELASVLPAFEAAVVQQRFGFLVEGNAPQDPQGEFTGRNIPYVAQPIEAIAARSGASVDDVMRALSRARATLRAYQAERPRPALDDKVLTAWNGLAIAAFARASRYAAGRPRPEAAEAASAFHDAAVRAARAVRRALWDPSSGTLLRRLCHGHAAISGFCEDYAYLTFGLLELFQVDGDVEWLAWARELQRRQDTLFGDEEGGGWFATSGHDESVLLRLKDDYDGAEPSAGSFATLNALTLAHLVGDDALAARARRAYGRLALPARQLARVLPLLTCARGLDEHGITQIVIVGPPADAAIARIRACLGRLYLPFAVTIWVDPERAETLRAHVPLAAAMPMREGRPTVYLCTNFTCQAPLTDEAAITEALEALARPGGAPGAGPR
ncbi:MAG: thioredoxin domain-containing protein [Vicinamibacterales bacterium]